MRRRRNINNWRGLCNWDCGCGRGFVGHNGSFDLCRFGIGLLRRCLLGRGFLGRSFLCRCLLGGSFRFLRLDIAHEAFALGLTANAVCLRLDNA